MGPVYRGIRHCLLVLLVLFMAALAVSVYIVMKLGANDGCERETISRAISPDGAWIALVHEDVRSYGLTTDVSDTVQLLHVGARGCEGDVFTVDSGGNPQDRPVIRWLAPRLLQIAVPNKSLIGLNKEKFEDVTVRVKFNPDAPKEKERWLKEIKRGPKLEPVPKRP